jgi:hypothetical protein
MNQQVLINSLNLRQAFKFILEHERLRHLKDIAQIDSDLERLRDVELPEGIDLNVWCEIEPCK